MSNEMKEMRKEHVIGQALCNVRSNSEQEKEKNY